jgi:hypothetical protein
MQLKAEILLQLTPFPNWFQHSIDAEVDGNCKTWSVCNEVSLGVCHCSANTV